MKKILEKEIYETPVLMEISPVSFVAGEGTSGGEGEYGNQGMTEGDDDLEP